MESNIYHEGHEGYEVKTKLKKGTTNGHQWTRIKTKAKKILTAFRLRSLSFAATGIARIFANEKKNWNAFGVLFRKISSAFAKATARQATTVEMTDCVVVSGWWELGVLS